MDNDDHKTIIQTYNENIDAYNNVNNLVINKRMGNIIRDSTLVISSKAHADRQESNEFCKLVGSKFFLGATGGGGGGFGPVAGAGGTGGMASAGTFSQSQVPSGTPPSTVNNLASDPSGDEDNLSGRPKIDNESELNDSGVSE